MVSSKDGWYPSGTKCSDNNGYCIMGKCLEFASIDKTPKHQLSEKEILDFNSRIQPRHLRSKRELLIEPPIKVGIGEEFVVNEAHDVNDEVDDVSEIAFDQPVDIEEEWIPNADFQAFTNAVSGPVLSNLVFLISLVHTILKI